MRKLILICSALTIGVMFIAFPYRSRTTKTINAMESNYEILEALEISSITLRFSDGNNITFEKNEEGDFVYEFNYFVDIDNLSNQGKLASDLMECKKRLDYIGGLTGCYPTRGVQVNNDNGIIDIFHTWIYMEWEIKEIMEKINGVKN